MDDALTLAAIDEAARELDRAPPRWRPTTAAAEEAADAAKVLGTEAVDHLRAGRWDEAVACAEQAVELDELHGSGEVWRELALLVEEAAETGRYT